MKTSTTLFAALAAIALAIPVQGRAQTAPADTTTTTTTTTSSATTANGGTPTDASQASSPISMSAFEVSTTQDTGYVATNSATAFKTDQPLITIPQSVMVVTRDLIEDTGYGNSSDVLAMVGVADFFRGESFELRGERVGYSLIDELPDLAPYEDNFNVDNYQVIRGPAAVFYPYAALSGIVLKTTRKPQDFWESSASYSIDQWGMYRAEFDTTGPITKFDGGTLSYRVEGVYQDGTTYFNNEADSRKGVDPSIQWSNGKTKVLLELDLQQEYGVANGAAFISPDGNIEDAAGRRNEANMPPGGNEVHRTEALRLEFDHTFNADWEMKTYLQISSFYLRSVYAYPTAIDFANSTVNWAAGPEKYLYKSWAYLSDFTGKYELPFHMEGRSTFGVYYDKSDYRVNNYDNPSNSALYSWANEPMSRPMSDYFILPAFDDFTQDKANPVTAFDDISFTGYYQEDFDIIKDRVSLVGGGSWTYIESDNVSGAFLGDNTPYNASVSVLSTGLYRVGAVVQIVPKQVAVYVLQSTTAASNGTALNAQGKQLPDQEGKGSEVGIKLDTLDEKVTATFSAYHITLTNVSEFLYYLNGDNGLQPVYGDIDGTVQNGWDMFVTLRPVAGLQIIGTYQNGTVRDILSSAPISGSYRSTYSVYGKYEFPRHSILKGLSFGGGASRINGRLENTYGQYIVSPEQKAEEDDGLIRANDRTLVNLFLSYHFLKHYTVGVGVNNLLDVNFAQGAEGAGYADPSPPRTVSFKFGMNF